MIIRDILSNYYTVSTYAIIGGSINYIYRALYSNKHENTLIYSNGFIIGGLYGILVIYFK